VPKNGIAAACDTPPGRPLAGPDAGPNRPPTSPAGARPLRPDAAAGVHGVARWTEWLPRPAPRRFAPGDEDEYRQRLLKAIEQKVAGQEIQRVEVEARPPTTDLVETLKASLGRKELAKVSPGKSKQEPVATKRPARCRRAS
jgi:hypothetical protein